jgi:uncharacterized protein (TIGR03083 family)
MGTELSARRCRQALEEHTQRLAEHARAAGAEASVPTCPGWTVADLVAHVGQTQHWASQIVEHRIVDPSRLPTEFPEAPGEPDAWPAWLSATAARAAAACSDAALDAAVFNPSGDFRTGTRFWLRSLLNEAVIHGVDAAAAAGSDHTDIDTDIAAELVTNHLAMLTSPGWAAQRADSAAALRGDGQTLHWHATDEPNLGDSGEWLVERRPDGATWRHRHATADVTIQAPARSLLLVLTRRVPLTDPAANNITVDGDIDLARHWVQHTAHVSG